MASSATSFGTGDGSNIVGERTGHCRRTAGRRTAGKLTAEAPAGTAMLVPRRRPPHGRYPPGTAGRVGPGDTGGVDGSGAGAGDSGGDGGPSPSPAAVSPWSVANQRGGLRPMMTSPTKPPIPTKEPAIPASSAGVRS